MDAVYSRPYMFMERFMVRIADVAKRSPAERAGIRAGDLLLAVNGREINDRLDYDFRMAETRVTLSLEREGKPFEAVLRKREYADAGIEFATFLIDGQRSCRNKCIFCFIDQLPPGLRCTLYFKDDDSRMSFLSGSYITLTNLSESDIARIVEMKTSPVNISVHTTDPELRVRMMKNPAAAEVCAIMRRFADANITMNCQIVLCRGVNDGASLDRTMRDLAELYPRAASVSVVPAGLTRWREGLYPLEPFTPGECAAVIRQVGEFSERCLEKLGSRVFFCADEFYVKAGLEPPTADFYEEFPQLDNGVGKLALMEDEFGEALDAAEFAGEREASIATGEAAYGFIKGLAERLTARFPGLILHVYAIKNTLFGENVTVAGLVTGGELIEQLAGRPLGGRLFLPEVMLRHERDMFLDDVTPAQVSDALGVPVTFLPDDGYKFVEGILKA